MVMPLHRSTSESEPITLSLPACSREPFVPIRTADLVERLCSRAEMSAANRTAFVNLARLLAATFHFQFHQELQDLKNDYAPFDPDADTGRATDSDVARERLVALFDRFGRLLERANYRRLSEEELNAALAHRSDWGLNLEVDFDLFERLELYARGDTTGTRSRRNWRKGFRWEEVPLPIYQRLVVILRLRNAGRCGPHLDTQNVFIKLFKDIPQMDLEMLLPGTKVRMSLVDRTKIILPTLTGLGITAWKIVKGAMLVAAAGASSALLLLGLLGGTLGYGARSLFGYLRTKEKYQLTLTKSLYFQNLDNNAGVLCRLLDEAEEQENREALLAYYFLWQLAPAQGWSSKELDRQIEGYLREVAGRDIDFEVGDALDKLIRLDLVQTLPNGCLRAIPIAHALTRLDQAWDHFFEYHRVA
jgi:hypothetical protein